MGTRLFFISLRGGGGGGGGVMGGGMLLCYICMCAMPYFT